VGRRAILRVSIPVDARWHTVELGGPIVHVATRELHEVEVWFLNDPQVEPISRRFTVVGTGHDTQGGTHVGTAIAPGGALVWHLVERVEPA
jgi:hypothetical protein